MATEVEQRVVEMRFDNKQFEQGTKQTLSSLQKLKEALNFTKTGKVFDGMEKAANNVTLSGISDNIELLSKRFSTLGIVGMRVIENLTDSLMNKLGSGINFIMDSVKAGGFRRAMNLEKAHFQLQQIIGDESRVQAVMNAANKSVDGTAYSFDVAAKAASQFYASSVTDLDSMDVALRSLAGTTATFSADYESMAMIWTQVAGQGRLMGDQLLQLSTRGANAAVTISEFINGVNSGSIDASESVVKAVKAVSNSTKTTEADIREFVSKGKINFDIFTAAMDHAFGDSAKKANETFDGALSNIKSALARIGAGFVSPLIAQNSEIVYLFNRVREKINDVKKALVFDEEIGNVHALSKQVTDTILNIAKVSANFVEKLDLSKPMEIFYYGIESVKNVGKGLGSVLIPIAKAFRNVFLSFSIDDVVTLAEKVEKLTQNFKLTEKSSKNLQDTFQGLFDVIQLVGQGIVGLIGIVVPVAKPINSIGDLILRMTGGIGRSLTKFSQWVRSSERIQKSYNKVANGIQNAFTWISKFLFTIDELPVAKKFVDVIGTSLNRLGEISAPYIKKLNDHLIDLRDYAAEMIPKKANEMVDNFRVSLEKLTDTLSTIDFGDPISAFKKIYQYLKALVNIFLTADGVDTFVANMKAYFKAVKEGFKSNWVYDALKKFMEAFDFTKVIEVLNSFKKHLKGFIDWLKNDVIPVFSDVSIGGIIASGTGIGIVYSFVKIAKSFEKVAGSLKAIPDILGSLKGVLEAYQSDLKASAILKIASAISILVIALVALSFADLKKVSLAINLLGGIAAALLFGVAKLLEAANKGKTASDALFQLGKGLKKGLNNLTKAIKWKAIGGAIKDFGITLGIVVGAIIVLGLAIKKDEANVNKAVELIAKIVATMVGIIGLMSLLGTKTGEGMKSFEKASSGILAICLSLMLVVVALKKLFALTIPEDANKKLLILGGIFAALAALVFIISKSASIGGGNKLPTGAILATTLMLIVTVSQLKKLFNMELPDDYKTKLAILGGVFVAMGVLSIAIGKASKEARGPLKAGGTILAMVVFLATVTAALAILSFIDGKKLISGALALGVVLVSLGLSLKGAGKIANKDTYKSVLSMALIVGSITAALGVLSLISWSKLLKAVVALGSILGILAVDLTAASKISGKHSFKGLVAMAATILIIVGSLVVLASQPWESLLASTVALGGVLSVFGKTLKTISSLKGIKPQKISLFLTATLSVVPLAAALYILASQPWSRMVSAGAALSATVIAFSQALKTISATKGINTKKIGLFLLATLAVVPIGTTLYFLADKPWENLISAGLALSGVLLAISGVFTIISAAKPNLAAMASFLVATVSIMGIAYSLYKFAEQPIENVLASAVALSGVLLAITAAMAVCTLIGAAAGPAIAGIILLDAFIANFAAVLVALGAIFNDPATQNLLSGGADILAQIGNAIGGFVGSIVEGALVKVSDALPQIGTNLSLFAATSAPFFMMSKQIDESSMAGIKNLAQALLYMTGASVIDGLTSWLTGGSSFIEFGKQLAEFGPYLSQYYESIKNVDGGVVEASANAAQVLSDMANKLPNSGGLAGKIFGENNLSDFGVELEAFGPHLAKYAQDVSKVNSEAVVASANAAQVMADLATTLPNSGGLASKILGDNKLSDFGAELEDFGPHLASYALSIADLDGNVVIASANAAKALSELATNLPNSGGLLEFFAGGNDISDFGDKLVVFGSGLQKYYNSISGIGISSLLSANTVLKDLVQLAKDASGTDMGSLNRLSESMGALSSGGISNFVSAFQNATPQVSTAVTGMMTAATTALEGKDYIFTQRGGETVTAYFTGFKSKYPETTGIAQSLVTKIITAITVKNPDFLNQGSLSSNSFLQGFKNNYPMAVTVGQELCQKALAGVKTITGLFYQAGANAGQGFVNGLNSKLSDASSAGRAIANSALQAAKRALDEHSPSKEFEWVADMAGIGFVDRLLQYVSKTRNAGKEVGEASVEGIKEAISNISNELNLDLSDDVVIKPIMDLSEIEGSASEITKMFNDSVKISAQYANSVGMEVRKTKRVSGITGSSEDGNSGSGNRPIYVNMEQNNYSPKALSRMDIYRDTNNQARQLKEALKTI